MTTPVSRWNQAKYFRFYLPCLSVSTFDVWFGLLWFRTNRLWWTKPLKCRTLTSSLFLIEFCVRRNYMSKCWHAFGLLETHISSWYESPINQIVQYANHIGRDATTTRISCRYSNVWYRNVSILAWAQKYTYGTTEYSVSYGSWDMCCFKRVVKS